MRAVIAAAALALGGVGCGGSSSPCTNKATDSCTPHLASYQTVQVDTLRWRIVDLYQASRFGPLSPNGVYIVAVLNVYNAKNGAAKLNDDVVKLSAGPRSYPEDISAEGAMDNGDAKGSPIGTTTINPGESATVTAVFDVPRSVVQGHPPPELQFNELGFGTTHGYLTVALPLGH